MVCDVCGKKTEPIPIKLKPTVAIEGDTDFGWKSLNFNEGDSWMNSQELDYCSPECAKKQIDNIWNNELHYRNEEDETRD